VIEVDGLVPFSRFEKEHPDDLAGRRDHWVLVEGHPHPHLSLCLFHQYVLFLPRR
jgi:hypothetical protein